MQFKSLNEFYYDFKTLDSFSRLYKEYEHKKFVQLAKILLVPPKCEINFVTL